MKSSATRKTASGFSLVEVMVAVLVICVGLLGIAKMQALALSNTTTARLRSLAAMQAASLAAIMHSNRQYWGSVANSFSVAVPGFGPVGSGTSDPALTGDAAADLGTGTAPSAACDGTGPGPQCTPVQLAGSDLARWTWYLKQLLPNPSAQVTCGNPIGINAPANCMIVIAWSEKAVAMTAQELNAAASAQFQVPTYTLYVEP